MVCSGIRRDEEMRILGNGGIKGRLLGKLMSRGMFAAVMLDECRLFFFRRATKGTADKRRAFKVSIVSTFL